MTRACDGFRLLFALESALLHKKAPERNPAPAVRVRRKKEMLIVMFLLCCLYSGDGQLLAQVSG